MTPDARKSLLLELMTLIAGPLRNEMTSVPGPVPDANRTPLIEHLAWVESVRASVITGLEEAAVEGRATAIRAGMAAGLPGSAFVDSTGLTLARIYQIRDGRR